MKRILQVGFVLSIVWLGFTIEVRAEERCYDVALVGRIVDQSNFVPLDELVAEPESDAIYLGGRLDLRVSIDRVLVGEGLPHSIDTRAVMTDVPSRRVQFIFFLRRGNASLFEAVDWDFAKRDAAGEFLLPIGDDNTPTRCKAGVR